MRFAIKIVSIADGSPSNLDGTFVRSYSPDAFRGRGDVVTSKYIHKALLFDTKQEAMEFWRQPSTMHPTRPDGKPNRPLTAFTVEIVPV